MKVRFANPLMFSAKQANNIEGHNCEKKIGPSFGYGSYGSDLVPNLEPDLDWDKSKGCPSYPEVTTTKKVVILAMWLCPPLWPVLPFVLRDHSAGGYDKPVKPLSSLNSDIFQDNLQEDEPEESLNVNNSEDFEEWNVDYEDVEHSKELDLDDYDFDYEFDKNCG